MNCNSGPLQPVCRRVTEGRHVRLARGSGVPRERVPPASCGHRFRLAQMQLCKVFGPLWGEFSHINRMFAERNSAALPARGVTFNFWNQIIYDKCKFST